MTTENTNQKFATNGGGYNPKLLSCTYTPVYYGFNCSPRQVRYYKVEQSVEEVIKGGYYRDDVVEFLNKVNQSYEKAKATQDKYNLEIAKLENEKATASSNLRQYIRKQIVSVSNREYNNSFKVRALQVCVDRLTAHLAE
jgi:hypothetical protein